MDYDDNDFQNQNLHLAGEGGSKFPPLLRPYALPKFDFDESLQGHLRFDSLVDTEVFLGIGSNEDNQWIEAYSRGSSAIEFSSTAAESCSISRQHNVWSEATSLESVEMLLKSVGQEEFIPRQAAILESDACNELACLNTQMEPNPKSDDQNEFKDNIIDSQPPGCMDENLSGSKENVEMEQSLAGVSQGNEGSIDGGSSNLQPLDIHRDIDLHVPVVSLFTDSKYSDTKKRKVETLADGSLDKKTQDGSSTSGVKTNITAAFTEIVSSTCNVLNSQNGQNQVFGASDEGQSSSQIQINKQDVGPSVINKESDVETQTFDENAVGSEAHHTDKPLCSVPEKDALGSENVAYGLETGMGSFEDSFGMVSDGISNLQNVETCGENTCVRDLPQSNASEDAVMEDQSALNTCDSLKVTTINDDCSSEGVVVEISYSHDGTKSSFQQNVETVEKKYSESSVSKENELLNIGHHMDTDILFSETEADNNIAVVSEGTSDKEGGDFSSFNVVTSTKPCILGEGTQLCENNESDRQSAHEQICKDVSVDNQESKMSPLDSSEMHRNVDQSHLLDKGSGSSSLRVGSVENELTTTTASAVDVMPINNSASHLTSETINSTSCEIDVPPPSGVVSAYEVADHKEIQRAMLVESVSFGVKEDSEREVTAHNEIQRTKLVESVSFDEKVDYEAKIVEEAGLLAPVSTKHEIATCPVTGTETHNYSDTSRQCEIVSNCLQHPGTTATEKTDPEGKLNDNVNQECSKDVGISPDQCESTEKQGDEVTVPFINDDKEAIEDNHDKLTSKFSGPVFSAPVPDSHIQLHETGGAPSCPTDSNPTITFGSTPETEENGNQVKACRLNSPVSELINRGVANTLTIAPDPKGSDASKDGRSLTSEVNPVANLSQKDIADLTTKGKEVGERLPVPLTAANRASMVADETPVASGLGSAKSKIAGNISHGSPQISDGEAIHSVSKGTPERKTRRASNKAPGKESSRKRHQAKEKSLTKQSERGGGSTSISLSPPPGFQLMHSNEVHQYGHSDSNSRKPFALFNASTSNLPDLNTSASLPVLFQQPFMDIQQIQLRAQIFVYGALIQGIVPDETHMIASFGGQDGGRSVWEGALRSCIERQHGQKSHPGNLETPLQSQSGPRATDLTIKGNAVSSPLGRAGDKATPTIVNPSIPLSSPVWSLPTPSRNSLQSSALARGSVVDYTQTVTSLHPYQTPLRSFFGHNTSWITQAPPCGPWIASPCPAPDNSSHLSASPVTETIKLNSVEVSSLPPSSGMKNFPPGLPASSACLQSISVTTTPLLDTNNVIVSHAQHSSDPKPRKRKKAMTSEDFGQKALQLQSQLQATPDLSSHISTAVAIAAPVENVPVTTVEKSVVSSDPTAKKRKKVMLSEDHGQKAPQLQSQLQATPDFSSHISTAVAIATPVGNVPVTTVENSVVSVSPLSLDDHRKSDWNVENKILSDETLKKVKEAKLNAEEASALSAAAVNHSLDIWKQLDKQKNSGLVSDIEAKLASAEVAVAAAAAVAKAAAAAANVALSAALQAKLMADEALVLSDYENSRQIYSAEGMSAIGKATPASILKGSNGTNSSSSIIVVAKEAARRRVEAASAARIQAENIDAIVKAAELAAEAVSQAGKVVTMGDPLPLSDLVEAGPEGCWNATKESSQQAGVLKDMTRGLVNIDNVGDRLETSHTCNTDILSDEMGKQTVASVKSHLPKLCDERPYDAMRFIDGISTSINIKENSSRGSKGCVVPDLVNPINVLPESETEIQASLTVGSGSEHRDENNMKEGSLVEVFKDGGGLKPAWFTGNILSLKDGKAYVGYSVLLADEGVGPLKEWASLESEGEKPPRIRIARPLTGLHNEGTRKRRRTTMVDYTWSVGDSVDAWIQESWQEGVITDKNKKDETALTVHFPASGETSVVRAWHLRPSLIWKDGKWIEPSRMEANSSSTHEGDTPNEKRPKLGSAAVEVKVKGKISKGIDAVESANADDLDSLNLAENEKVFNIGSKNENKPNTERMPRSGLQKEGSRVIFGVPKPGKKRKFMDVSKHYVADGTSKISDGNDSVKLANFLMPRSSRSQGWKNSCKTDTKEKVGADTKPKTFKSGKPLSAFGRVIPLKKNPLPKSRVNNKTSRTGIKDSSKNAAESASHSGTSGAVGGSNFTSADSHHTKKASTSRATSGKVETERTLVKSTSEVAEPRRSNRRIQPTSRLLEGLQSSLTISKIPGSHHEKGHKTQNRNATRGENMYL